MVYGNFIFSLLMDYWINCDLLLFMEYQFIRKVCIFIIIINILRLIWDTICNPILYKNSKYHMTNETLIITKGSLTSVKYIIPLKRIQHVDIEQTFFSRIFNLYLIDIYTAGDSHNIQYIKQDIAEELKEKIVEYLIKNGVDIDE